MAAMLIALFLSLLAAAAVYKIVRVKTMQAELQSLQTEMQQYDRQLKEIESLEKEKELLLTRIGVIEQLKKMAAVTVRILDDVAVYTPSDRIWLTDLSQNSGQVQITGMSLDNQTVARYMTDLEKSAFLEGLVLVKSDMKKYADRDLKAFTVTSSIATPGQQEQPPSTPQ